MPEGYLYVKESSGVTVEELESSPSEGYTYRWTATSGEASVTTQRMAAATPGPVLTFMYKSDRDVPLSIVLDENSQNPVRIEPLTASSDWRLYEFDMGQAVERCGWGGIGSRMQLLLGGGAGTVLEIKQLHMRERNTHENELASALFIELQEPRSDLDRFEDMTEYFSYETGFTYLLQAEKDGVDPYIHTVARSRAIASGRKLSFFRIQMRERRPCGTFSQDNCRRIDLGAFVPRGFRLDPYHVRSERGKGGRAEKVSRCVRRGRPDAARHR